MVWLLCARHNVEHFIQINQFNTLQHNEVATTSYSYFIKWVNWALNMLSNFSQLTITWKIVTWVNIRNHVFPANTFYKFI